MALTNGNGTLTKSGFDIDELERLSISKDVVLIDNSELSAMLTEIRELRAENARLNTDLRRCFGGEAHAVRNERVMQKIHDYTENALARAALGEPQ